VFKNSLIICFFLILITFNQVSAQTHISVPLGHPIYLILEQAQMRGLCSFLPAVKPYSRAQVISFIDEILNNDNDQRFGKLSESEKEILEQFKISLTPQRGKTDLTRGTISAERTVNDIYLSGEFGFGMELSFAGGYYPIAGGYNYNEQTDDPLFKDASHPASGDFYSDVHILPTIYFIGDLGRHLTYGLTLYGWIGKVPRTILGKYNNLDADLFPDEPNLKEYMTIKSEPLTSFPYTYKKRWDGFVFPIADVNNSSHATWPESLSIGYYMLPELAGEFFGGHLTYRFARMDREWSGMSTNASLVLNQSAQPFLGFETVIAPFSWIAISSLTGVLEYHNAVGEGNKPYLRDTSSTFQNAFSIVQLEFNIKNYFNFGLGSSVIWPKRFELGYPFPLVENLMYQNNIGDFDNMALFINMQGQYPGLGKLWISFYLDEINISPGFLKRDRNMFAYQLGGSFNIPWLPFASITVSYTKNEPYNYTHNRIDTPWYTKLMEENYVSFGRSLGHYIPPNSDEILLRFETIPFARSMFSFQYQMIRHGADYGDRAVDGSSLWSELPTKGNRDLLEKYFLHDGAYQWMHIVRFRGEYSLTGFKVPVKVIAEIGGVYSYWTDIDSSIKPNTGSYSYKIIDTPQYPHSFCIIGIIGVHIFPK